MSSDQVLVEELRASNPVALTASQPNSALRAALLEEILTMSTDTVIEPPQQRTGRRRKAYYGATAAAVAAAITVVVAVANRDHHTTSIAGPATQTTGVGVSPGGPSVGSCIESYDLATLTHREVAFDGTVTKIEGTQVTFSVIAWFKGGSQPSVTLDGNGMTGSVITSAGGPTFTVGQRFLVAGDGGFAWSCGFTQAYQPIVAEQWRTTFASP